LYAYEGSKTLNISSLPSIEQNILRVSAISVGQGETEFSEALTTWYWRLVWLSGFFMLIVMDCENSLSYPTSHRRTISDREVGFLM
jgi:hypothetical protein